jgi:NAD(P)-dependent dehydrogenase (short-subunit alcohol dehydrogenase family)
MSGDASEAIDVGSLFKISGKTALVTGGSRGIGFMIARGYIEAGVKVYITARKAEACDAAAKQLSALGTCISIPADIGTADGRARVVGVISDAEDSLEILVNNAGASWGAPLEEYPDSAVEKVMNVNVNAMFALTRDLLPLLKKGAKPNDPARVLNIGSIDGLGVPKVDNFIYPVSKAAVHHLTHVLAAKLGEQGVTVNAIAPGPFESKMTEWMLENFQDSIEQSCPLNRIGAPADMAGIAIYLASRAGAYVNGAVIPVDGGIHLK